MKQQIFRKAALEHLTVSERLDTAVQVVSPATYLVVAGATATIAMAVLWAAVGRVPSRVYGEGLLVREGTIVDVTSMADGQIQRLLVKVGDVVHENDPIAYVDQPELKNQASLLETKLEEYTAKYAQLAALDEQGTQIKRGVLVLQGSAVGFTLAQAHKQLTFYEEKLAAETKLLDQGLTTATGVAETRQKVIDLHDAIHAKEAERRNIAFDALESTRALEERKYDLAMQVSDTRRQLEELRKRIDTQSVVVAKTTGRVIEVKLTDGDAIARGRPIATLEAAPNGPTDLVAEVFVPAGDGKRVKAGMLIKLSPTVVKPEEDGYLEGVIDSVSPYPVSEQSMLRTVRNESLVSALLKDGPVYEARVRVATDRTTPSGLRWSNGKGPNAQIASGTPVHGLVTVRTRRPIELVVPALERIVIDAPSDTNTGSSR
jgi:HlyD family secretion protein